LKLLYVGILELLCFVDGSVILSGSDFQIIPSSTGAYEVTKFMIEGKDNSCIRWEKYIHSYTVNNASDRDAGLYMWKMMLNNKYEHCGSFEISIALPGMMLFIIGVQLSHFCVASTQGCQQT
jgi:hypothetical protein